jgi:D-alanyl-D-alanine carboxypeptidase
MRIVNKRKFFRGILALIIMLAIVVTLFVMIVKGIIGIVTKIKTASQTSKEKNTTSIQSTASTQDNTTTQNTVTTSSTPGIEIKLKNDDTLSLWNLKLVNKDNSVDRSYVPDLEELDDGIMFDKRAITYLRQMISAMNKAGITNVWVASAYRSYDKQEQLFNNKVTYYKNQGKTQEEAEALAQTIVQRPEMSEHNLALAADFNTVTNEFEKTKAFQWLKENAEDYGFILRYPEDKQDITGITYESWHWRYVGKEHAKIMNEKGYCLEEYIDYLKSAESV